LIKIKFKEKQGKTGGLINKKNKRVCKTKRDRIKKRRKEKIKTECQNK